MTITTLAQHTGNVVLAELVEQDDDLALAEARAVTDETREALWHAAAAVERAVELVARAVEIRAHEVLIDAETGRPYGTWKRYCQVEFLGLRSLKIAKETRLQLVAALIDHGVSRRGAAEAMGLSEGTMRLDLKEIARREQAAAPAQALAAARPMLALPGPRKTTTMRELLDRAGTAGLTIPEAARKLKCTYSEAGATLSRMNRQHDDEGRRLCERLAERRDQHSPYVRPWHVEGREVLAPGQRQARAVVAPAA